MGEHGILSAGNGLIHQGRRKDRHGADFHGHHLGERQIVAHGVPVSYTHLDVYKRQVLELSEEVESIRKFFVPSNFAGGDAQIEWVRNNEETLRDECQMDRITPLVW